MSTINEDYDTKVTHIEHVTGLDESLHPKSDKG